MKIDRLIGIITLLLQHEKVTAPYLAERFEVSKRTINRDIEDICKAGIPLVTIQGYGGGISIADGYKIDKTILTEDELKAVFAGLKSIDSVSKISYTQKLIDKLSAHGKSVFSIDGHIMIDLASFYQEELTQKIELIKSAISNERIIAFRYYYSRGETDRLVEPYLLIFKWSSWYLYAYCLKRNDYRLFKLNRLWNLQQTEKHFDLREVTKDCIDFENYFSSEPILLIALFDECVKYRLIEEYGIDCYSPTEDGKLLLKRYFTNQDNLLMWILSFGDKVKVIEPKEISAEIIRQSINILKKYEQT